MSGGARQGEGLMMALVHSSNNDGGTLDISKLLPPKATMATRVLFSGNNELREILRIC
jgi:hypothetical protein